MSSFFWMIRVTSEWVSQWACKWTSGLPAGPGCERALTDRASALWLFLRRALQRLRLGDDVCNAAPRLRRSCLRVWVLQSCWIQQELSRRERWGWLRKHHSESVLFNVLSMKSSDLEHILLYRLAIPSSKSRWSLILLAVPYKYGLFPSTEKKDKT